MIDRPVDGKSNLKSVDIHSFRSATRDITFDVYLRLGDENYAHVFSRATGLDYKRLAQYIAKGVKELLIRNEDEPLYQAYIARTADTVFNDPKTSTEKKVATLLNMTEQNMAEIFLQTQVSEETAASAQKVIKNYVQLMVDTPKTLAILLKLASHGEYLYYHSIACAIFSMFIAKASGQFNQRMLEIVGMGGFLHDIGCAQIPKEITCSPTELTPAQWREMRSHPKLGLAMLENCHNVPDEVRYIVYQHHEEPGGHGYPNGLHGPVIYYPSKIVALADAFSALISKRPFRPPYTTEQAIHILQAEGAKYDRELVRILSSIFLKGQAASGNSGSGGKKAAYRGKPIMAQFMAYIRIRDRDFAFRVQDEAEARSIAEFLKKKHKAITYELRMSPAQENRRIVGTGTATIAQTPPHTTFTTPASAQQPAPAPEAYCVLIVEDEVDLRDMLAEAFESKGCKVLKAENARSALMIAANSHPDMIVSDVRMAGGDGIELFEQVKSKFSEPPAFVLMTAFDDERTRKTVKENNIVIFRKPFDMMDMINQSLKLPKKDSKKAA